MSSNKLSKKFIEGLEKYNLTYEEIIKNNWKYCGGDTGRHYNYFKLCFPKKKLPTTIFECVCGHKISENCFITNEDNNKFLTLGNCCIKKFIPNSTRTCGNCGIAHKNRKVNRCSDCRYIGICRCCDAEIKPSYKICFKCYKNK
jgi:hypothetical protein